MSHIFKPKTLRAKLADYQIPDFETKLQIIQNWLSAYKQGKLQAKTESECEQAFNQDFFVNILGYQTFPAENYTLEAKGKVETGGQKPDAILGRFSSSSELQPTIQCIYLYLLLSMLHPLVFKNYTMSQKIYCATLYK